MRPLEGVRILDLSRLVAGGMAGMVMADFGADVVKVERPGHGDPLRQWTSQGKPLWWKVYARNKRFITLNLKSEKGRNLLLRLLPRFDVMMESFVPGTLERLGLGWEDLHAARPGLVLLRISGWGQTGRGSTRPGFGTLVEAASGFAAMNGEADRAPIVPAFPLSDAASALYATTAIMFGLYHRDVRGGSGQVIDLTLFESLFSLLGPLPAEYAALGRVRQRDGSRSKNAGPRGCYLTRDGRWLAVSGSTPRMAQRFLESYGLGYLLDQTKFATNEARVAHALELDEKVAAAIAARTMAENMAIIEKHGLTAAPVQTIADIEADPHWRDRELTKNVRDGDASIRMHNVTPRFSETPGEIRWPGGDLGADNDEVYAECGVTDFELAVLRDSEVI